MTTTSHELLEQMKSDFLKLSDDEKSAIVLKLSELSGMDIDYDERQQIVIYTGVFVE